MESMAQETKARNQATTTAATEDLFQKMLIRPNRRKVSEGGRYQPFPNITVVCHLAPSQGHCMNKLVALPNTLEKIAGKYLSPLPFDSYHATLICGPLSIRQSPQAWRSILQNKCWNNVSEYLEKASYAPTDLKPDLDSVAMKSSGGVTLYFPSRSQTQESSTRPYTGDDQAKKVRSHVRRLGRKLQEVDNAVENEEEDDLFERDETPQNQRSTDREAFAEPLMENRTRPWHVTLAYPRASGGPMPNDVKDQVRQAVFEAFSSAYGEGPVAFYPAKLCLSPSMIQFTPWDGTMPREEKSAGEALLESMVVDSTY